jgi:hypothetical protein
MSALNEYLVSFGGNKTPNNGQIIILAGGGGSGKSFVLTKLLDIQGKVIDVDKIKELLLKLPQDSKLNQKFKQYNGKTLSNVNLRNPNDTSELHYFADKNKLYDKTLNNLYNSIKNQGIDKKPNLIFDITLANLEKFEMISRFARMCGYPIENIHLVWVLTDFKEAVKLNKTRERVVKDEIIYNAHKKVAKNIFYLLDANQYTQKFMNGDIFVVFNVPKVDTNYVNSKFGGGYIDKATYIKIKNKGQGIMNPNKISDNIYHKMNDYVPRNEQRIRTIKLKESSFKKLFMK